MKDISELTEVVMKIYLISLLSLTLCLNGGLVSAAEENPETAEDTAEITAEPDNEQSESPEAVPEAEESELQTAETDSAADEPQNSPAEELSGPEEQELPETANPSVSAETEEEEISDEAEDIFLPETEWEESVSIVEEELQEIEEETEDAEILQAGFPGLPISYDEAKAMTAEERKALCEKWYAWAIKTYVTPKKTDLEKAEAITRCVAEQFIYGYYSAPETMILVGEGDCWGATNLIIELAARCGLEAHARYGGKAGGSGENHRNAIFRIGTTYYVAEAGFVTRTKPRRYEFYEEPYGLMATYGGETTSAEDRTYRMIIQYDGEEKNLRIPDSIDGLPVRKIGGRFQKEDNGSVFTLKFSHSVQQLTIPETVDEIIPSAFMGAYDLSKINVSAGNQYYKSENGALYSKDGKTLCTVPPATEGIFVVPGHVTEFAPFAFASCQKLKTVFISSMKAPAYSFANSNALMYDGADITFIVPEGAAGYDKKPWTDYKIRRNKKVSSVTLSTDSTRLGLKESMTASFSCKPADAAVTDVSYASSDESVVKVWQNGTAATLEGRKCGSAVITATVTSTTFSGGKPVTTVKKAEKKVTVFSNVTNLYNAVGSPLIMRKGDEMKTEDLVRVYPEGAVTKLKYTSSDPSVAVINSDGTIKALRKYKTATITVTDEITKKSVSIVIETIAGDYNPDEYDPDDDRAACKAFGFCRYNGKYYWYENSTRQAVAGDPKNLTDIKYGLERGREIFDPESGAWYWLDTVYNGAKAEGKEVWIPYIYQDEDVWKTDAKKMNTIVRDSNNYTEAADHTTAGMGEQVRDAILNKKGKWVRYDENGKMLKGWVTISGRLAKAYPGQAGKTYFYDYKTGLMAKGWTVIGGTSYYFDETTGILKQQ